MIILKFLGEESTFDEMSSKLAAGASPLLGPIHNSLFVFKHVQQEAFSRSGIDSSTISREKVRNSIGGDLLRFECYLPKQLWNLWPWLKSRRANQSIIFEGDDQGRVRLGKISRREN
jgi:hypothetical protein